MSTEPTKLDPVDARQASRTSFMPKVIGLSIGLAVAALAVIVAVFIR